MIKANLPTAALLAAAMLAGGAPARACEILPVTPAPRTLLDLITVAKAAVATSNQVGKSERDRFDACIQKLKGMADEGKLFVEQPVSAQPTIGALNDLLRNGHVTSLVHHSSEGGDEGPYEQLSRTVRIVPAAGSISGAPRATIEHLVGTWNSAGTDTLDLVIDGFLVSPDGRPLAEVNQTLSIATSDCAPSYARTLVSQMVYGPGDKTKIYTTTYSFDGESTQRPVFETTVAGARALLSGVAEAAYGAKTTSLSDDDWKRASLATRDIFSLDSQAAVSGFQFEDFLKPHLSIGFTTPKAPSFENFAAYGELQTTATLDGHFSNRFISERTPNPKTFAELKAGEREDNLKETAYYNYSSPEIQAMVKKVQAMKPTTPEALARSIIWVINSTISDDPDADNGIVVSKTASEVVTSGKAVCQGYSALFVALARAQGLPSRTIVGDYIEPKLATTHAWVEVALDGKHWTPVEPQNIMMVGLGRRGYLPFAVERLFEAKTRDSAANDAALQDDPLLKTFDVRGITKL